MANRSWFDTVVAKQKEQQREAAAWWACVSWIVSGVYLFATTTGTSVFSFTALLFILVGMFAASITIGLASYLIERAIAWILTKAVPSTGLRNDAFVSFLGVALMAAEAWVVYLAARWVFHVLV